MCCWWLKMLLHNAYLSYVFEFLHFVPSYSLRVTTWHLSRQWKKKREGQMETEVFLYSAQLDIHIVFTVCKILQNIHYLLMSWRKDASLDSICHKLYLYGKFVPCYHGIMSLLRTIIRNTTIHLVHILCKKMYRVATTRMLQMTHVERSLYYTWYGSRTSIRVWG